MTRAVCYLRVSDDQDGRSTSIEQQRHEVSAFVKSRGWEVVAEEVDSDISASRYSRKTRHGWRRVLDLLDHDGADAIVAWDLDRLLRQPRELEDLIDRADKGLPVHTISGDLNLASADGRFVARILVAKAAKESDDLSRRVRRAKAAIARDGGVLGSVRAFGWASSVPKGTPGHELNGMVIVEHEAAAIRHAAARVLAGVSLSSIAREWNAANYERPRGSSAWSSTTVRNVLESPRNGGLIQHRGEVVGTAKWPAILDRATWERLVAMFNDPARKTGPRRRSAFTGVFRCGQCGNTMQADSSGGKRVWRCKPRPHTTSCGGMSITGKHVEPVILEAVFRVLDTPLLAAAMRDRPEIDDTAVADLADVERRMAELAEMFAAGEIDRREWLTARAKLEQRREALAAAVTARGPLRAVAPYVGEPGALRVAWPSMGESERNAVLLAVIDRVVVHPAGSDRPTPPDRMEITWRA